MSVKVYRTAIDTAQATYTASVKAAGARWQAGAYTDQELFAAMRAATQTLEDSLAQAATALLSSAPRFR